MKVNRDEAIMKYGEYVRDIQDEVKNAIDDFGKLEYGEELPSLTFSAMRVQLATVGLERLLNDIRVNGLTDEVPDICVDLARNFVSLYEESGVWPEDHWITLSKEWDLNLWHDNKHYYAAIYPYPHKDEPHNIAKGDLISDRFKNDRLNIWGPTDE